MQFLLCMIAGIFLPLFPLSLLFNTLFQRIEDVRIKVLVLLLWPLPGVLILSTWVADVNPWLIAWAMASAGFYSFRSLVIKDVNIWTGFQATSVWGVCWVVAATDSELIIFLLHALAFSVSLAVLALLVAEIEKRYESSYAGVVCGVAQAQPRLSGMLTFALLGVIASPLFPSFFSMLAHVTQAIDVIPTAAIGLVVVWLLWSWSGMRLLQELLVGPARTLSNYDLKDDPKGDLSHAEGIGYGISMVTLTLLGIYLSGVLL